MYNKIEDGTVNIVKVDLDFDQTSSINKTNLKNIYLNYCEIINSINDKIDLVLINGRFQIVCLITTFLTRPKARVLFHNYYEMYHNNSSKILEQISNVKERAYAYTRIERKNNLTNDELKEILNNLDFKSLDYR